jgi:hypothetical protein
VIARAQLSFLVNRLNDLSGKLDGNEFGAYSIACASCNGSAGTGEGSNDKVD